MEPVKNSGIFSNKLLVLLPIVIGIIAWFNQAVFVFLHSFINIFAGGRSNTKTFGFLAWWLLILALSLIIKKLPTIKSSLKLKRLKQALLIVLFVGYLGNFASIIWFLKNLGLKLSDFVIVVGNGELSATQLFHNHIFKGTIAFWLKLFHFYQLENIDAGHAFIGLIPNWIFISVTALIIFSIILFILIWKHEAQNHSGRNLFFYNTLFAIISFSLLKNLLDGGLLNSETVISLSALLVMLYDSQKIKLISTALFCVYLIFLISAWLNGYQGTQPALLIGIIGILVHALLLLNLFIASREQTILTRQNILIWILFFVMAIVPMSRSLSIFNYRNLQINNEDGAYVALVEPPQGQGWSDRQTIGDLSIYKYRPQAMTTIGQILDEQNLLDNFYPISVPWQTCFPKGKYKKYTLQVLSESQLKLPFQKNIINITKQEQAQQTPKLLSTKINIFFDPCAPRTVNLLEEAISQTGPSNFYLVNPQLEKE